MYMDPVVASRDVILPPWTYDERGRAWSWPGLSGGRDEGHRGEDRAIVANMMTDEGHRGEERGHRGV